MKREAYRHPKMLALASILGVSRPEAIGIMTVLLDWAADATPQGNIGRWPNGTIAMACDWRGEADDLIEALVQSGWVDRCPKYRLVIHDLAQHAEQWWQRKMEKLGLEFVSAEASVEPSAEASAERSVEPKNKVRTSSVEHSAEASVTPSILQTPSNLTPCKTPCKTPALQTPVCASADAKLSAADMELPSELESHAFRDALRAWFDQRRRRRLTLRPDYVARQIERLKPLGAVDATDCLRQTVDNDYQGIFPEKFVAVKNNSDPRGNIALVKRALEAIENE